MKYKIYPTLHSEIRKGTVWTYYKTDSDLIKIKNSENGKSIIVAHREIDSNFIKTYDQSNITNRISDYCSSEKIVFDEYYREKLGVLKYCEVVLEITPVKYFRIWYRLIFLKNHPDEVVKITFWFTFLTFIFSVFSYVVSYDKLIKIITHISACFIDLACLIFK